MQAMAGQGGVFAFSLPAGGPQIPRAQLRPSLGNDANQTGWSLIVISLLTSITLRGSQELLDRLPRMSVTVAPHQT
ncbi:Glutamate Receptor Ionotropic, Delta-2 [Manis pentadactyla]|nr:Glutamate Receptor Ionotropic, Delta-2 [Manis pentadactyla]